MASKEEEEEEKFVYFLAATKVDCHMEEFGRASRTGVEEKTYDVLSIWDPDVFHSYSALGFLEKTRAQHANLYTGRAVVSGVGGGEIWKLVEGRESRKGTGGSKTDWKGKGENTKSV